MATNGHKKIATVRIQRFIPDVDLKPRWEEFKLEVGQDTTILDALHEIKSHQDGTLTYRKSCRHAICGSCAMNVNGKNMLVCNTPINDEMNKKGKISIKALPYLPIIKDLVVDRTSFWEQYLRVKPWLIPPDNAPEKEYRMSPEEVDALQKAETCIMCGACYSSCMVVGSNKQYIGPHALLKGFMRLLDPRDAGPGERLDELATEEGVFKCHTIFNCIDACPKGLDPTKAIETIRELAFKRQQLENARAERQKTLTEPIGD